MIIRPYKMLCLYDFVRFVKSRRATTLRCIRSLWLSLFEIDFRMVMVMKKMIGYAVGANDYSPLQILTYVRIQIFHIHFSILSLLIINETFLYLNDLSQIWKINLNTQFIMKRIIYLLMSLSLVTFVSCSNNGSQSDVSIFKFGAESG